MQQCRNAKTMSDPAADDVSVTYCLTTHLDDDAIRAAVEQLSAEERRRHDRFLCPRDRRDFAVAHALLRRALSARDDRPPHEWTFTSNVHGRPALASPVDSGLVFNLSHTDGLVACVTARDLTIGIDVEAIDRETDALALARTFFSPTEVAALERCAGAEPQTRFIEIWTLREAYVKAIGEGLSYPSSEFAFVFDGHASLRFEAKTDVPSSPWRFALFAPSERHRMAIAVGGPSALERRLVVRGDFPDGDQSHPARCRADLQVHPIRQA